MANLKIEGIFQLRQRLKNMSMVIKAEAAQALGEEADIEFAETQRRVPVRFGDLKKSGKRHPVQILDKTIRAEISYGDGLTYGIFVHEDLDAIHPVGQAKFLESVIQESAPFMAARVGKRINLNKV